MNDFLRCGRSFFGVMGLLAIGLLAGCGSGDGGAGGSQAGIVSVSLTDAPACGFDQVNVTVSKVRIHQSASADEKSAGWTDITINPPRKINLLSLNDPTQPNFALETLGEAPLSAGHYTQLRLVLVPNPNGNNPPLANSVVLTGTPTEIPLDTPNAVQSGIKLIHQFTVGSGQRVDLLLDFDACHSIVQTGSGKYILKPVVKVIPTVLNGIVGFVDPAILSKPVVVSAQRNNGEIVRAVMPNANINQPLSLGKFFLAHLDPGNYDVVITADDHATAVITGVPVGNTTITTVSTSSAPFSLAGSTPPRTINGKVTLTPGTDDVTVFVAAKQSLNGGPTVTIKSKPTALMPGDPEGDSTYALEQLPPGAPSLGTYSATLPITLSALAQSGVAGKYAIQASAEGYQSQFGSVDVSGGDQTHDFALTP